MAQYASYRWLKTRKNRLNTQCEVKDMDEIYETQPERTDLPLVVMALRYIFRQELHERPEQRGNLACHLQSFRC